MTNTISPLFYKTLHYVLALYVLATMIAIFVPLYPVFPSPGLDGSYQLAINQALAQRLVFGKDVIFNMGPYAAVETRLYHPFTDSLMLWGGLLLATCYSLLLLFFVGRSRLLWIWIYAAFLAALMYWGDARLFSYPVVLLLVSYRISLATPRMGSANLSLPWVIGLSICFAPLGLLPLVKVSLLVLCGPIAVACCLLLWLGHERLLAYSSVVIPPLSTLLFWVISGQPVTGLPNFLISISTIILGYSEAMSISGNQFELVVYLLAATAILFVVASNNSDPPINKYILMLGYIVFFLVGFKEGFVRHDQPHALIAGQSIFVAGLSLTSIFNDKKVLGALALSILAWLYIDSGYTKFRDGFAWGLQQTYANVWKGLYTRFVGTDEIKETFNEHIDQIKKAFPIPILNGTVDIYSFSQSSLLASGNAWSPRPMPQSLTAYNPTLARLNEAHLRARNRPDNILFKIQPIDGRFPSLEDGLSWPTLLNGYYATRLEGDILYLHKRAASVKQKPMTEFYRIKHKVGEEIALPTTQGPLLAEIEIFPTLLGRLANILFKLPELTISVTLNDGSRRDFRFVPGMAEAGFLISPLVLNTADFVFLSAPDIGYLDRNVVRTIKISLVGKGSSLWNDVYLMKLNKLELIRDTDLAKTISFDKMVEVNEVTESNLSCDGSIDNVNDVFTAGPVRVSRILSVNGWTAVAASDGIVPESIFLTLANASGQKVYVKARSTSRDDLKEAFKQPNLRDAGFTAYVDVSALSGKYILGISRVYKGTFETCSKFNQGRSWVDVEIGRE